MVEMLGNYRYKDWDECWREEYVLKVTEIDDKTRIRIVEVILYDNDTDEPFWHGIKIQRIYKRENGKWKYKSAINIPFRAFLGFCQMLDELRAERDKIAEQGILARFE